VLAVQLGTLHIVLDMRGIVDPQKAGDCIAREVVDIERMVVVAVVTGRFVVVAGRELDG
jgi:hypothetical protein